MSRYTSSPTGTIEHSQGAQVRRSVGQREKSSTMLKMRTWALTGVAGRDAEQVLLRSGALIGKTLQRPKFHAPSVRERQFSAGLPLLMTLETRIEEAEGNSYLQWLLRARNTLRLDDFDVSGAVHGAGCTAEKIQ